jgi:hypothetical protein
LACTLSRLVEQARLPYTGFAGKQQEARACARQLLFDHRYLATAADERWRRRALRSIWNRSLCMT